MARHTLSPSGLGAGVKAALPMEEVIKDLCESRSQLNRVGTQLLEMSSAQRETNTILADIAESLEDLIVEIRDQVAQTRAGIEEAQGFRDDLTRTRQALEANTNGNSGQSNT